MNLGRSAPLGRGATNKPSEQEHPEEGRAIIGPYQPPTPYFGFPAKADRFPPPRAPRKQTQGASPEEGGHDQHKHGHNRGVHGALILLLGFIRRREEVASILRQWTQYPPIRVCRIGSRKLGGHPSGRAREQGEQDAQAKEHG